MTYHNFRKIYKISQCTLVLVYWLRGSSVLSIVCVVDKLLIIKCDLLILDGVHAMSYYLAALNFSFELNSLFKVLSDFR